MSMSLTLHAKAIVILPNRQKKEIVEHFELWQTQTKETYKILESGDCFEAYKDWAYRSCGDKYLVRLHIQGLTEWLKQAHNDGFTVVWDLI